MAAREPLSRDRVLRGALAFADEHGVEALTMRKLATALGFEVMSLYNHVSGKDEILDGIVELVAEEIDTDPSAQDWKAELRARALSTHRALSRHRWAAEIWSRRMPGPARLRQVEALLQALNDAGFSDDLVHHGFHALQMHIVGFTVQQQNYPFDDQDDFEDLANEFLESLPPGDYPRLTEHVHSHLDDRERDSDFEFVLDLLLDGLERAASSPA